MVTSSRPRLPATSDRWTAALERARREGVEVRQLAGCGAWIATSGSDTSAAYEVSEYDCACHAGQFGDPVCKHRAALRHRLGWPFETTPRSLVTGISDADVLDLKADAARRHYLHGEPLISVHTGEVMSG